MIGTALVNINNICKAEEHVYHFHVHVSLLLHSQGFVEEYDWMTSKINDSCCANHSLKDHMHKHTYRLCVIYSFFSPECPTNKIFMHWMADSAFYIMLINSENTEMALSVNRSACLWQVE